MLIRFKKPKCGPELVLVNNFLDHHENVFEVRNGLEVTVLLETVAEAGVPDILIVVWDRSLSNNWNSERGSLQKSDLKILHFISSFGRAGVSKDRILGQLCFGPNQTERTLDKLQKSDLIAVRDEHVRIKNLSRNFFVREIISIEAKIHDWKGAIDQAQLNKNFSSRSYLLLPHKKVDRKVLNACANDTGVLANDGRTTFIKKRAPKSDLPGSYFSWMINEYIGKMFLEPCLKI